jgi:hypothetical protein
VKWFAQISTQVIPGMLQGITRSNAERVGPVCLELLKWLEYTQLIARAHFTLESLGPVPK